MSSPSLLISQDLVFIFYSGLMDCIKFPETMNTCFWDLKVLQGVYIHPNAEISVMSPKSWLVNIEFEFLYEESEPNLKSWKLDDLVRDETITPLGDGSINASFGPSISLGKIPPKKKHKPIMHFDSDGFDPVTKYICVGSQCPIPARPKFNSEFSILMRWLIGEIQDV
ncbi:9740_t:CDS:2, partial [Funneliformis caledonium]